MTQTITLTKSRESLLRGMSMTLIVIVLLAFFVLSDYRATGELVGFGWLGLAAIVAGVVAIAQQYFYFSREPKSIHLDLANGVVINGDNNNQLAEFNQVTFFALGTAKTNALIECSMDGKMMMRLRRHYQLPMRISDILAKYSDVDGVALKFVGLTK